MTGSISTRATWCFPYERLHDGAPAAVSYHLEQSVKLKLEAETAYGTLHDTLNREQQKLLLRLIDVEEHLRDEEKLDAFFSGFRLADGIHRELESVPPYSFEDEDERFAREAFLGEHSENENG